MPKQRVKKIFFLAKIEDFIPQKCDKGTKTVQNDYSITTDGGFPKGAIAKK